MKTVISLGKTGNNTINSESKIKKEKSHIDIVFLSIVAVLLILGTLIIFSASYPYAVSHYGEGSYYVKRQIIFLVLGLCSMTVLSMIPVPVYKKVSPIFYTVCILLLILVLFGGFSEGVAKRWLGIPGTSLTFQPSELMKLGIILMLSYYIDKNYDKEKTIIKEIIIPGLFLFGACGLVLLEKHLSGTVILALIGLSVMFISGASIKKMGLIYGATAIASGIAFLLTNEYAMKRIESFLNPNADVLSDKWQTTQGLYAIGSGGLYGLGYTESRQKYSYVSEPQNDFIFTIWCEELGFIGAVILIAVFVALIWRGYNIALHAPDRFSSLVAFGITSQIGIQSMLNMLVVTDLIPNTGISLPFFSYGGSSLLILLSEVGIVLSISKTSRQKK